MTDVKTKIEDDAIKAKDFQSATVSADQINPAGVLAKKLDQSHVLKTIQDLQKVPGGENIARHVRALLL